MDRHISYNPLWKHLIEIRMTRTQMAEWIGISRNTLAKMGRDEYVALKIIERICNKMKLNISDVIEMIEKKPK
mgnify:CR=1 FL=1